MQMRHQIFNFALKVKAKMELVLKFAAWIKKNAIIMQEKVKYPHHVTRSISSLNFYSRLFFVVLSSIFLYHFTFFH